MNERFKPLRVRAYLQTGIISDQYLPIDAVLYNVAVREKLGPKDVSLPNESTVKEYHGVVLPIRKANIANECWFYKSSFAQWPENTTESNQHYTKRFDIDKSDIVDFGKNKPKIDNQRGHYKSYHVKVYYRHAPYVEWYMDADKEEIEKLLLFCTHIGKKTSQGWGSVLSWDVQQWPEDWSVRGMGNKLMRNVPLKQDGNGFVYGLRPSYWNPRHKFVCKMP